MITAFCLVLGSSTKHVSRPVVENSKSVLLINFMLSFIYRPVPPAFVSEFWPMNSYPGKEIFCIPLSVNLVSEIAMTLGISFTVNKISLRRHIFLGKLHAGIATQNRKAFSRGVIIF